MSTLISLEEGNGERSDGRDVGECVFSLDRLVDVLPQALPVSIAFEHDGERFSAPCSMGGHRRLSAYASHDLVGFTRGGGRIWAARCVHGQSFP